MSTSLFPLFADLRDREVVVIGGGTVARRKVQALLDAGAIVTIGAPELEPQLAAWAAAGTLRHRRGHFRLSWLRGAWLVVAATDDAAINKAVAAEAQRRRIWVNVVDDAALSSVQIPARIERGPLQIAISSGGAAPMLARHLRERLETQLDESLGPLTQLLGQWRETIRAHLPDLHARRRFFERLLHGSIPDLLRQGDTAAAQRALLQLLDATPTQPGQGRVALVGAGPGDPGLLTLRALRLLNEADVILHDRLVSAEVLALARRDAERIDVGKRVGSADARDSHHATQQRIHALMIEHARAGRRVVRLKGGDSFVFGRGGEELEALQAHGIAFEVVPGITAALACGAYAGIPLTHRDHAQSVRLITAHCRDSADTLDWSSLSAKRQTLVFYMGVAGLEQVRERLLAHGTSMTTPFALVENGSRPQQRVVVGMLDELVRLARLHAVQAPALLIVGDAAALATKLHWFGAPPLGGINDARQQAA